LEAIQACSNLGVEKAEITFMREPDSALNALTLKQLNRLATRLANFFLKGKFSSLALPWRRDPHSDHKVVNQIGDMMLWSMKCGVTKIEYPVWLWKNGEEKDWPRKGEILPFRLNIQSVFHKKWKAIKEHKSQLGEVIFDDIDGFILTESLLDPFKSQFEYFFITNHRPLGTLGVTYFDALYKEDEDPWNFTTSDYEHQKYQDAIAALGNEIFEEALEIGCSVGVHTKLLADVCKNLFAIDISAKAISKARQICYGKKNVRFEVRDVSQSFPSGNFDLITLCEVGYYFDKPTLLQLFENIHQHLQNDGKFLMVHWTGYVPEYPLTGNCVHDQFRAFAARTGFYKEIINITRSLFILQVWEKSTADAPI
jgi:SAM-dependent methyltransferase